MGSPFAKVTKDVELLVSYLLNMLEEDEVCSTSSLKIDFKMPHEVNPLYAIFWPKWSSHVDTNWGISKYDQGFWPILKHLHLTPLF